jgi:predicted amidohydrolase
MLASCALLGLLLSQAASASGSAGVAGAPAPIRTSIRLALMKGVPPKWDMEANFRTFLRLLDDGSGAHADLFVTPECWLDGYGAADKTSTHERLRGVAQNLNSSAYLKTVAEQAKKRSMAICFGFGRWEDL